MNNAIQIKSEMKYPFLEAVRLAGLQAEQLKSVYSKQGNLYYRVFYPHNCSLVISQDVLFRLGVYYAQLTWSKADDFIIAKEKFKP